MAKLEGIIYKTFEHYVVLRGFAPIEDLAQISHKPDSYQRNAIDTHKKDIIDFLSQGEYKYFPEITLACRVVDYDNFVRSIGIDNAVDRNDARFVNGLQVLGERLPYGYRARHAYIIKKTNEDMVRVDGNHRLEPFENPNDSVWTETGADYNVLKKLIVPFTVIFSAKEDADKFEAGIFHNINFKQEPLRQEASLKIIYDLGAFEDKEKLGPAYPMALKLIDRVKGGRYNMIPWLKVTGDVESEYYRTTCLRIAQLLTKLVPEIKSACDYQQERLNESQKNFNDAVAQLEQAKEYSKNHHTEIEELKQNLTTNQLQIIEKSACEFDLAVQKFLNCVNDARYNLDFGEKQLKSYLRFIEKVEDADSIENAINIVSRQYERFTEDEYGNIALLCAMVYYSLLDNNRLNSFVDWVKKNGINKIVEPDDLSEDASSNLVEMFEHIHQAKRNEIFISMQFGDSQSELIYEKIVRAIERFNTKHKDITLNAKPIRIDRTIESSTFSIQDKILDAIKSCSLIIADLSSANINVYHEIGYAMGVAQSHDMIPNMILLYKENTEFNKEKKSDVDKFIGFNLRNLSQLRFTNYDQLVEGLVERLEKHYGV